MSDSTTQSAPATASATPAAVAPWRAGLARAIYSLAWLAGTPFAMLYLLWRGRRQPAYRRHWAERFGRGQPNPDPAPVIWIHAVSVGETRAAQPLVEALLERYPQHRLLLTHMTPTGRETGRELYVEPYSPRVTQAYLPYDLPAFVRGFLGRYRPVLGLILETELWPNLVHESAAAGVPLVIVNARLSDKSLARGLAYRALLAPALGGLSLVLAQNDQDAARMRRLGPVNVQVAGNLKFDVLPRAALLELGASWRHRIGRPVVVLASSREGEEALVLRAWQNLQPKEEAGNRPILVIVPRHPQRFAQVRAQMEQTGLGLVDRAAFDQPATRAEAGAGLVLGDSMGEMPAWYAMADVVIMGGSLLAFGGQNLIEACACGAPVVLGPSTYNFELPATQALSVGAARQVQDADAAVAAALALLADGAGLGQMQQAALAFAASHRGATANTLAAVAPWLARD